MRLSTEAERDEERALATIGAALAAGVTVFDTARAYAASDTELGHNARLLARALAGHPRARVVTKGGMSRPEGRWVPDGRARALAADCEASLEALGRPIDLYLLHAPDPRTSWSTSVRALLGLRERGLVPRVGLCNVNRRLLDEALALEGRLKDLRVQLNGDPTMSKRNEPVPPGIVDRVQQVVAGHWSATSDVTATHRRNYEIAAEEFAPVLEKLRTLVESDLRRLEDAAEAAGAPWTPGRVPSWRPE